MDWLAGRLKATTEQIAHACTQLVVAVIDAQGWRRRCGAKVLLSWRELDMPNALLPLSSPRSNTFMGRLQFVAITSSARRPSDRRIGGVLGRGRTELGTIGL